MYDSINQSTQYYDSFSASQRLQRWLEKESTGKQDMSLLRFTVYIVYRPHELYRALRDIMVPAIVTGHEKGYGFLSICYLKIILRGLIGSEQSIRYSELGGCPLLGGL